MNIIKTLNVLLIEDNPADIRLIMEIISEFSIENKINVVKNGVEALDYLYKRDNYKNVETPNLILLDLNLPKKSGLEVLKEIKKDNKLKIIPVIVLTTSRNDDDLFESYDHHANAFVTKPADLDKFIKAIRSFEDFWFNMTLLPTNKND